jgi:methanogenic corrinoid protein MtbC1
MTDAAAWRGELGRIIEGEIVPRLLMAHGRSFRARDSATGSLDLSEFVDRLVAGAGAQAWDFVSGAQASGLTSRHLLLELLAPAARRLGTLWEDDRLDFLEVTVGLGRLQEILHRLTPDLPELDARREAAPHALLLPAPGETHGFGIAIVETFFRAAGWRVTRGGADFLEDLRCEWFDVVGFSLSNIRLVDALAAAVRDTRSSSINAAVFVLVGGPAFAQDASLLARVGADATAVDAPGAVDVAGTLLGRAASA